MLFHRRGREESAQGPVNDAVAVIESALHADEPALAERLDVLPNLLVLFALFLVQTDRR